MGARNLIAGQSLYWRSRDEFLSRRSEAPASSPPAPAGAFFWNLELADSKHPADDSVLTMAPHDQKIEVVQPAEVPEDLPLPSDPKVIFLGGLFVLAVLAAAYVASDIVLPLVFAIVLKLLLQPALRILVGLHVPRTVASLLLIVVLFGTIVGLGTAISGPARTWTAKLPEGIPRLEERLSFMRAPINTLQGFLQQVEDFGATATSPNAATPALGLNSSDEAIHWHAKLYQRLLHDGAIPFFPSRVR